MLLHWPDFKSANSILSALTPPVVSIWFVAHCPVLTAVTWQNAMEGHSIEEAVGRVVHRELHPNEWMSVNFSKLPMPGMPLLNGLLSTKAVLFFS